VLRVVLLGLWVAILNGCAPLQPAAEEPPGGIADRRLSLVESAPIGTSLDQPDIEATHAVWADMVAAARYSIALCHFYASNKPGGGGRLEPIVVALENAVRRGVAVRFLADASFVDTYPDTLTRLERAGVDVRRWDLRATTGGVQHAKYMVIDGRELYLGSANFDWRALEHIYELGVRLAHPGVAGALLRVFDADWLRAAGVAVEPRLTRPVATQQFELPSGARVQLVASPRGELVSGVDWDLPKLKRWLAEAQQSVRVQLLSVRTGPDPRIRALLSSLQEAAARGVRVRLLVSHWNTRDKDLPLLRELMNDGVDVRIITIPSALVGHIPYARVAHAKYMVVDGQRSWIGTSNWSAKYFVASRNVGLLIEHPTIGVRLTKLFDTLADGPYSAPFDPARDYPRPRVGD